MARASARDAILVLAFMTLAGFSARADEAVRPVAAPAGSAAEVVGLFTSFCVSTGADPERVATQADALNLPTSAGVPGTAMEPERPGVAVRAWRVSGASGAALLLGTSSGLDGRHAVASCTLAAPAAAAEATVAALKGRLGLDRPFRREPDATGTTLFWRAPGHDPLVISATTAASGTGVVLAATARH